MREDGLRNLNAYLERQNQAYVPDGALVPWRPVVALLLGTLLALGIDGKMECRSALTSHFKLSRQPSAETDHFGDIGDRQRKGT